MSTSPSGEESPEVPHGLRQVRFVLVATLVLNAVVALSKIVLGSATNLHSVTADGLHSLTDMVGNIVGLVGLTAARRPQDDDHPYGHRKFETLTAIGISFLVFFTSAQILEDAFTRFLQDWDRPDAGIIPIAVLLGTLAVNVFVTLYERAEGRRLGSEILLADARHTQSDLLVSISVLASVGFVWVGWPVMDTICSFVVGVAILRTGYGIISDTVDTLVDAVRIDPVAIRRALEPILGVLRVDQVRTRGAADHVFLDLTLHVDGAMSVRQSHAIADEAEDLLRAAFPAIEDIVVHIEPLDVPIGERLV